VGSVGRPGVALLALLLAGCKPYVQQPPERLRADNTAVVRFATSPDAACRQIGAASEGTILGCHHAGLIVIPNPCAWPNRSDYADLACHELGHRNGWPGNHPES
jgi:hypothetical protein